MMGYWGYGYDNMGMGFVGAILMFIFWALSISLVVMIIRRMAFGRSDRGDWRCRHCRHMGNTEDGNEAIDILKTRYAKGEIKKEEFEQMKKDLEG